MNLTIFLLEIQSENQEVFSLTYTRSPGVPVIVLTVCSLTEEDKGNEISLY